MYIVLVRTQYKKAVTLVAAFNQIANHVHPDNHLHACVFMAHQGL